MNCDGYDENIIEEQEIEINVKAGKG